MIIILIVGGVHALREDETKGHIYNLVVHVAMQVWPLAWRQFPILSALASFT